MWGVSWQTLPTVWPFPRTRLIRRHTFAAAFCRLLRETSDRVRERTAFTSFPGTFFGGSTRDRELTAKQGAAAVFWQAIREAKRLGMTRFDFGGCTPTEDAFHLQTRVLSPLWDRVHPLYFRLLNRSRAG